MLSTYRCIDVHCVPIIWSTTGPAKIDHISKLTLNPNWPYILIDHISDCHITKIVEEIDHIFEISSSVVSCLTDRNIGSWKNFGSDLSQMWMDFAQILVIWKLSQPSILSPQRQPSLLGHKQPGNWPRQQLTIYPKSRPYIWKIVLYESIFPSVPIKNWPYRRNVHTSNDHISDDHIFGTQCTKFNSASSRLFKERPWLKKWFFTTLVWVASPLPVTRPSHIPTYAKHYFVYVINLQQWWSLEVEWVLIYRCHESHFFWPR